MSKNNPYQYIHVVCFIEELQRQSECFKQDRTKRVESKINLPELTELLSETYKGLTDLLYLETKDYQSSFRNDLLVKKHGCGKLHNFYLRLKQTENKQGKYSFQELKELHKDFDE